MSTSLLQDDPDVRKRVKIAMGLLVGAKALNVSVPFLFKYAVDTLNTSPDGAVLNVATASDTILTYSIALLLGCELAVYKLLGDHLFLLVSILIYFKLMVFFSVLCNRWHCSCRSSWI